MAGDLQELRKRLEQMKKESRNTGTTSFSATIRERIAKRDAERKQQMMSVGVPAPNQPYSPIPKNFTPAPTKQTNYSPIPESYRPTTTQSIVQTTPVQSKLRDFGITSPIQGTNRFSRAYRDYFDRPLRNFGARLMQSESGLAKSGVDAMIAVRNKFTKEDKNTRNGFLDKVSKANEEIYNSVDKEYGQAGPGGKLLQAVGSSLPFMAAGFGTVGLLVKGGMALKSALVVGNVVSTVSESLAEAGNVYDQNVKNGMSEDEAFNSAARTFVANSALIYLTNKLELFKQVTGDGWKSILLRLGRVGAFEGGQEVGQQVIQNIETGKPALEGTVESGTYGAIVAIMTAGLVDISGVNKGSEGGETARIKDSQALPIDKAIELGEIPAETVYQNTETKVLQPDFARGRIQDIALKLERIDRGLGDTFRSQVDENNSTMDGLIAKGLEVLADAKAPKIGTDTSDYTAFYKGERGTSTSRDELESQRAELVRRVQGGNETESVRAQVELDRINGELAALEALDTRQTLQHNENYGTTSTTGSERSSVLVGVADNIQQQRTILRQPSKSVRSEGLSDRGAQAIRRLDGIIQGAGGQEADGIGSLSDDTFGREEWSFELARRLQLPAIGGRLTKAGAAQVYSDALTYYKEAFGRSMPVRERMEIGVSILEANGMSEGAARRLRHLTAGVLPNNVAKRFGGFHFNTDAIQNSHAYFLPNDGKWYLGWNIDDMRSGTGRGTREEVTIHEAYAHLSFAYAPIEVRSKLNEHTRALMDKLSDAELETVWGVGDRSKALDTVNDYITQYPWHFRNFLKKHVGVHGAIADGILKEAGLIRWGYSEREGREDWIEVTAASVRDARNFTTLKKNINKACKNLIPHILEADTKAAENLRQFVANENEPIADEFRARFLEGHVKIDIDNMLVKELDMIQESPSRFFKDTTSKHIFLETVEKLLAAPPKTAGSATDNLITEARKYETLEEFVKAQEGGIKQAQTGKPVTARLYHGSPDARFAEEFDPMKTGYYKDAPDLLPDMREWESLNGKPSQGFRAESIIGKKGVSFTDSRATAKSYSEKPAFDTQNSVPMVLERYVMLKNPKVYDMGGKKWDLNMELEMRTALENGYDGLVFKNILDDYHPFNSKTPANNIIVFDTNAIKTRSQLTDIWNKAHGENNDGYVRYSLITKAPEKVDTLPADISVSQEAKAIGAKRIAPDRVPHQQLTPEAGMDKMLEAAMARSARSAGGWMALAGKAQKLIDTYGDSMPSRNEANLKKYPTLVEDWQIYQNMKANAQGGGGSLSRMRDQFKKNATFFEWSEEKKAKYRNETAPTEYKKLVKKDISMGYRYPRAVIEYDRSFSTAIDARARYEKGLRTSFGVDDARIVTDYKDIIGAGIKRQDGKELTEAQRKEIVEGVVDFAKVTGLDMKKIAERERWVYVHLNGKNPFLMKNTAGLYRQDNDGDGVSISVGGTESTKQKNRETGKLETVRVNTTMSHEIGHALDYQNGKKLLERSFLWNHAYDFNPLELSLILKPDMKYWRSNSEITARMIEQYIAIKRGHTAFYTREGYWPQNIFDTQIMPVIERTLKEKYADYQLTAESRAKLDEVAVEIPQQTEAEPQQDALSFSAAQQKKPEITFDQIQTRPDLFQQTRSFENLAQQGYEGYKVEEILKNFDEKRILENPISVAQFDDGTLVVTSGHNRLEVLRRAKEQGLLTQPDSAYMKVTQYSGESAMDEAVQESIDTNIREKSVKDINIVDLYTRGIIDDVKLNEALAFDASRVKYVKQIANTFRDNNLQDFWARTIGPKLAQLKGLSYAALQERLNFVSEVGRALAQVGNKLGTEETKAVQNTIGPKVGELVTSAKPKTLQAAGKAITKHLDIIASGGYKNNDMQSLFGTLEQVTEVDKSNPVGALRDALTAQLSNKYIAQDIRDRFEAFRKQIDDDVKVATYVRENGGATVKNSKTQQLVSRVADGTLTPDTIEAEWNKKKEEERAALAEAHYAEVEGRKKATQPAQPIQTPEHSQPVRPVEPILSAQEINSFLTKIVGQRRTRIRAAMDRFTLTDKTVAKIRRGRDIRYMDNAEFDAFIADIERRGRQEQERSEALRDLGITLYEGRFRGEDNLRQAMKLPPVSKMTTAEIKQFNEVLSQYNTGDRFFSVRKLETVKNTDLSGIRTYREARERLAAQLGTSVDNLPEITVKWHDVFRWDAALMDRNPMYRLWVDEKNRVVLNAEARIYRAQQEIDRLMRKARTSKKRSLMDRIVPTDDKVFEWLEAKDKNSVELQMTREEIEAAKFIQAKYAEMRDYLIQNEALKKYRTNYVTHMRKGFLEGIKSGSLKQALVGIRDQYKQDEAVFNILNGKTGEVLPLEKFFKYSMQRNGGIDPTKNVARAFMSYLTAFEKKVALDAIVPKLDIYVDAVTPEKLTPRGLEFDQTLKTFFKRWMNTQKGRVEDLGGLAPAGGTIDTVLRSSMALVRIVDLGLNIPLAIAQPFGENISNYVMLGEKGFALGVSRLATAKGRAIVDQYRNFVGRSVLDDLVNDTTRNLPGKIVTGMLAQYRATTNGANAVYLLGNLTDAEWKAGKISTERLAAIKAEMGRWRAVEGTSSIIGATSPGKVFTMYKTWAMPIARSTIQNLGIVGTTAYKQGARAATQTRAFKELRREITVLTPIVVVMLAALDDEDDKSFVAEIYRKVLRDALSLIGALDASFWVSTPRLLDWVQDTTAALMMLGKLETYKTGDNEGTLKGDNALLKQFTPAPVRQVMRAVENEQAQEGADEVTGLPNPPTFPKLPELPSLPGR